ncbi:MAG: DUF4364 family protein [Huintestinicola sp.]|uniref:DUF4364 family protein n=1 Tax=Huintestinicola sp. TaxID=2981661 RepID=UPI003F0AC603
MSGQQMTSPELNSVHSVKILLCYILEKLNRPVTEEQLRLISEDSGVINYFYYSDALSELIRNGSVISDKGSISLTEKGRLGSEYFNRYIPLVFRKKLLKAALGFFIREQNEDMCSCAVSEAEDGCMVSFALSDGGRELINMSFFAPDTAQGELIAERIRSNPGGAYKKILGFLLDNSEEEIDVEKYL